MVANKLTMTTTESRNHIELVLKIARMYYTDNLTQAQIAAQIGYSRPTISRLLSESRDRGMVRIEIGHPLERLMQLEDALVRRYGLKCARVAQVNPGQDPSTIVPRYAAALLTEKSSPDSLITVSNGRAVAATVREVAIQDWPKSNVAQMVGALSPSNPMTDSPDICRMLAERLGGTVTTLHVPMILSSAHIAAAMRQAKTGHLKRAAPPPQTAAPMPQEPQIATALALGGGADVALEGVGATEGDRLSPVFDAYVTPHMVKEIRAQGAVATVCGHFIDAQGRPVCSELSDRIISVELDRLKRIALVIGVAWGQEKVKAIKACLVGSYISALATDQATAESLLA